MVPQRQLMVLVAVEMVGVDILAVEDFVEGNRNHGMFEN